MLTALLPRFARRRAHGHTAYERGLLGEVERKNGRQLAESAGYAHPRSTERVLEQPVANA